MGCSTLRALLVAFLALTISACAHAGNVLLSNSVKEQLNGRTIDVSGYLVKSPIGGLYLYESYEKAKEEDYSGGIDVVWPASTKIEDDQKLAEGRCAVVSGLFTSFNKNRVGMGYYRSKVGYISARRVRFSNPTCR